MEFPLSSGRVCPHPQYTPQRSRQGRASERAREHGAAPRAGLDGGVESCPIKKSASYFLVLVGKVNAWTLHRGAHMWSGCYSRPVPRLSEGSDMVDQSNGDDAWQSLRRRPKCQIRPFSAIDITSPPAIIRWSRTRTSIRASASFNLWVISSSA